MDKRVGFVCFGEVNTPIERLQMKHDEALGVLTAMGYDLLDAGLVIVDDKPCVQQGLSSTMKNTRPPTRRRKSCAALICAAWSSARRAGCRRTPSSA